MSDTALGSISCDLDNAVARNVSRPSTYTHVVCAVGASEAVLVVVSSPSSIWLVRERKKTSLIHVKLLCNAAGRRTTRYCSCSKDYMRLESEENS